MALTRIFHWLGNCFILVACMLAVTALGALFVAELSEALLFAVMTLFVGLVGLVFTISTRDIIDRESNSSALAFLLLFWIVMPAVMAVAPNGAITGVFAQKLTAAQVDAAIVTPAQTRCMRALQDKKLVLLCVQPTGSRDVPIGVQQFKAAKLNVNRTHLVSLQAGDPAESEFLQQLKVRPDTRTTVTAFMAPPGVLLGTFNDKVTPTVLMTKLAAAGQCCDDPNCKHGKPATATKPTTRR
mgnify:CR=1 FL=1